MEGGSICNRILSEVDPSVVRLYERLVSFVMTMMMMMTSMCFKMLLTMMMMTSMCFKMLLMMMVMTRCVWSNALS